MSAGRVDVDSLLRSITCYRNVARVRTDVVACISQVRTLIPKIERLIHNNGMESELLVLAGTVAINYQGRQYNIPVEIYVSEPYPDAPPRCYVRPTKDMDIKLGHRHVDREGLVYLPYLHEWNARSHNLTELCAAMSSVFGVDPPVYAVRKPPGQQQQQQQQQQPHRPVQSGGYPGAYASGGGQPLQPNARLQPPPAYETVARPTSGGGYPSQGVGGYGTAAQQQAQAEVRRREAVQQVMTKTQSALQDFYGKVQAELTEEQDREEKLKEGRREIASSINQLRKMKEDLLINISNLSEKDSQLDAWLKEQSSKPELHVDDMVEAADVHSKQMLDLVAQNGALEDALYHMDRAVANSTIDTATFLKKVRELAREQFMSVAHVNKIWRSQQVFLVSSRAVSPPRS